MTESESETWSARGKTGGGCGRVWVSDPSLGVGSVPCRTDGTTIMTVSMTKPQRGKPPPWKNQLGLAGSCKLACCSNLDTRVQ